MMRWIDPSIELAACGSSGRNMPTFGRWEDEVLEHTFEHVEYISLHTYLNNYAGRHAGLPRLSRPHGQSSSRRWSPSPTRSRRGAGRTKRIMLSFDEWNVWYRTRRNRADRVKEGWPIAPPILEEIYTMEDALAFGGACISLLNHADRVKSACLAQLVNVIAPIMTEKGGPAWRQTIFHPFAQMSRFGRGRGAAAPGRVRDLRGRPTTIRAGRRTSTSRSPPCPTSRSPRSPTSAPAASRCSSSTAISKGRWMSASPPGLRRSCGRGSAPAAPPRSPGLEHQGCPRARPADAARGRGRRDPHRPEPRPGILGSRLLRPAGLMDGTANPSEVSRRQVSG